MIEQRADFRKEGFLDYVSGLPEGFKRPEPSGDGSNLGPPKTAIGAGALPPEEPGIKPTPLEYSMPNPNSRFGTHPPKEVFASGFPNWHRKDLKNRITEPIDRT